MTNADEMLISMMSKVMAAMRFAQWLRSFPFWVYLIYSLVNGLLKNKWKCEWRLIYGVLILGTLVSFVYEV